MQDYGAIYTDKQIAKVEKELTTIYNQALKDIEKKEKAYLKKYKKKSKELWDKVNKGKIDMLDYVAWENGQVFQGEQWENKKNDIIQILSTANQKAIEIVNGKTPKILAVNANETEYALGVDANVNFSFGLYSMDAVKNLIKNNPKLLPMKKLDKVKDNAWNRKKINRQISLAIIEGEDIFKVAERLAKAMSSQNKNSMLTMARTAMTGAQNAGRQIVFEDAKKKGIEVKKEWMATLDGHTRYTHRMLDGQKRNVNDRFEADGMKIRYPGDPEAHPSMVYNCRCTMVGDIEDFPEEYERYDNIEGKPIKNVTYQEWEEAMKKKAQNPVPDPMSQPKRKAPVYQTTEDWIEKAKENPDVDEMLEIEDETFNRYTEDEVDALETYTGSSFKRMNNYLRYIAGGMSEEDARYKSGISDYLIEQIKNCHSALSSQTLDRDMVLRRGTDVGDLAGLFMQGDFKINKASLKHMSAEELNDMFQGMIGQYAGFTSTSSQWDRGFDGSVEIMFNAPKGTPAASIMRISQFGTGEGETLLIDGIKVICEKIEKSDYHMGSRIRVFLTIIV